ncbi:ATP-binding cassette sub-family G member 5 [Coccidioides immitis H538.4]|uniref:ATP-binding cassette sub-family G member 5 n=1 Tax=Coccidioides immitis H538.4 TaxID=396776 RepID=A0A0J8RYU0_COCIT|nr:ATP-binding cassette sub-family G member 5 [Coccidioides immitis H538.4]
MIAEEKGISRVEADEEAAIGIDSHVQAAKHQSRTHLSFRKVQPVDVHVKELVVRVDTVPPIWQSSPSLLWDRLRRKTKGDPLKTVLDGVTAAMPSGSLTAIIGGSGSGKTSLLNVMAGRMNTGRVKISGSATFNGHDNINSVRSAYVMQQDVLIPTLTVRETLQYSADLRLPPPTTHDERQNVVNNVILELGLKECADTRIGTTTHKGCSGGEKRRTSIGVQMLSNPSVLFCDEPTTGLDATSAFQVIKTLKALARDGRTVIVSIHAPRSEIWGLFDQVILLSRGSVLYSGPVDMALSHFEECGHSIPAFVNPAEFLIDLAAYDNRSEESEFFSRERIEKLQRAWRESPNNRLLDEKASSQNRGIASEKAYQSITPQKGASFSQQFRVLTARTMKMTVRDPMGMTASLFEAIGMAVMNGWVYLRLDRSLAGIRSRQGSLYTASSLNGYLILLYEVFRLTTDIQLFDRERNEGVVGVPAFLLSRRAARLFLEDLPVPCLFSVIFYFMVGYRLAAPEFFIFLALNILTQYLAVSFASVCISLSRNFPGASLVGNLSFTLQTMACGFFVQANQIPVYVRWIKWMTYTFYVFGALCANEFIGPSGPPEGQFYDCPFSDDPSDPYCKEYTGRFILETLGLPSNWIWRPMVALVGFITLFFGAAYLILQFRKVDMDIAQSRSSEGDLSAGKEKFVARLPDKSHHVSIRLDNYALEIQKRRIGKRGIESRRLRILRPISAEFRPGQLNVIMGPSGSGKTSLLCSIARRLHGSIGTRYHLSGQMLYNSSVPSENVIRAVSSFVTQDDDALMPSLTVRESLQFAAGLRLPSWMSKEEKNRRAEDILLKMGLKDCADNLIGSDLIKGISGGEKRRVTIAIQILTDPKVLLLDEPTSGLDAFTATSIIDALNGLAAEGRTLILTIHQARSDLFHYFSNILLLARGGHLVYAGKGSEMLPHFKQLGYPCPEATNPADFVLDLITIDLQEKGREDASRERVQRLISGWEQKPVELTRQTSVISTPAELGSLKRKMSPFHLMYPLVLRRSAINLRRQPHLLVARTMQVIGIAIILTLFFAPLKKNYESVQSRMGFIQQLAAMYFVGMLQCIAIYPYERDVFYREESDNCYSVEAFILQYTSLELPFEIASSLIFGVVAAFAVRLESSVKMLFILAFNCFCIVSCGESLGIMFCTLFSHVGFSVNITSVLLSISTVLGGVLSLNVPAVLQAFNHLSPIKYSVSNLAPYAMTGQVFTCTDAQRLPNGNCPIETGEQVLMLYNQDDKNPAINVMALGLVAIGYRLVAYLLLKAMRSHGISKSIWIGLSKSSKKPQA